MNLIEQIKDEIEREDLIPDDAHVVVGVSGGADSIALLHALCRLGYPLSAAHLNHSIRGKAADGDERFVIDLSKKLGVQYVTSKVDVPALASERGISIELAARAARHEFFRSVCPAGPSVVCLAHHADDQLETFFLRAARGTGPAGLGGMRVSQQMGPLQLVRPLLSIRRSRIVQWLEAEGLDWREDATNADETVPRNRVRHQILPVLGEINERAAENILRTMAILRAESDDAPVAAGRRAARDWLIEHGVTPSFDAVERFVKFSARTDGTHRLDLAGLCIISEYGLLRVDSRVAGIPPSIRVEEGAGILRGPWQASVSAEKVAGRAVTVRAARPGDRMAPYGMDGSKKLQDIFTDLKIPKAQREHWPLVECGGEIIWLPGYRIARGWELARCSDSALHFFSDPGREDAGPPTDSFLPDPMIVSV